MKPPIGLSSSTPADGIEQRDRETERQRDRDYRDTHDTDETDEVPPSGACVGTLQKAAEMALRDKSNGDPVFRFARAVKAFELHCDARLPENELEAAFNIWWSMATPTLPPGTDRDESLFLFMDAYQKAKTPLGSNVIENAVKSLEKSEPPAEARNYSSPKLKRLVHLCYSLQRMAGDEPFFLSVRDAARVLELSPKSLGMASSFLHGLERDGILYAVERGKVGGHKATRFRYGRADASNPRPAEAPPARRPDNTPSAFDEKLSVAERISMEKELADIKEKRKATKNGASHDARGPHYSEADRDLLHQLKDREAELKRLLGRKF